MAHWPGATGGARWAARERPARAPQRHASSGGRLALGRHRGRLLHAEERHALVAFGPPQSGKSAGLAVPALLEWDGPAVASSIKTDLLGGDGRAGAARSGRCSCSTRSRSRRAERTRGRRCARRGTWDGALEVAWRLAAAGELDQRGVEGGDFWAVAAEQRLAPLLYTAAADRRRDGRGRALGLRPGRPRARRGARSSSPARPATRPRARRRARRLRRAARVRGAGRPHPLLDRGDRAGAAARLPLQPGGCARRGSCEITADRLLDERATLYLIGDAKASKLLRPIFLALLSEVVDRAYERATLAGGRLELPLLLCLDEAGNVAPLPNLAEIASTAPSHNIQLVSIFHDLAQARSRYGRQAETVVNSHRARMLLPGVADLDTLRYFSGLSARRRPAS